MLRKKLYKRINVFTSIFKMVHTGGEKIYKINTSGKTVAYESERRVERGLYCELILAYIHHGLVN